MTWIPLAAEVEWYEGHRSRERPRTLVEGDARLELTVESASTRGPETAGRPVRRVFLARDPTGRRLRIGVEEDGRYTVEEQVPG